MSVVNIPSLSPLSGYAPADFRTGRQGALKLLPPPSFYFASFIEYDYLCIDIEYVCIDSKVPLSWALCCSSRVRDRQGLQLFLISPRSCSETSG